MTLRDFVLDYCARKLDLNEETCGVVFERVRKAAGGTLASRWNDLAEDYPAAIQIQLRMWAKSEAEDFAEESGSSSRLSAEAPKEGAS